MQRDNLPRPAAVRGLESACGWLAGASLLVLVVLVTAEVVARSFFHYSFEIVDEVGGYLLAALSFFALAPSLAAGSFHSVELVQQRISPAARRRSALAFQAISLAFTLVLGAVLCRHVWRSWVQQDVAPTHLQTSLWIPQLVMVCGIAAMAITLLGLLVAQWRTPGQTGPEAS
jgi:TRAP-type C4-dicarboxylate transport system permease small subunit